MEGCPRPADSLHFKPSSEVSLTLQSGQPKAVGSISGTKRWPGNLLEMRISLDSEILVWGGPNNLLAGCPEVSEPLTKSLPAPDPSLEHLGAESCTVGLEGQWGMCLTKRKPK